MGSGAEETKMSGVEIGEVGDGGHSGCDDDGDLGRDGSRLSA